MWTFFVIIMRIIGILRGAKKNIQSYKPKLAICIYHRPEDIFEIPLYIKSIMPEYQLYLGHKRFYDETETVCYAI
ncbi:hypothetical protein SAMN04515679_0932 [Pelosinus fermentans]|nr:hypothetical protein FR7_00877 [Pelosinus fermentans DSM 17108]SDQ59195.1 hypothetical protein SAMN04515679_0932 [Pelosinus fermentans]